MTLSRFALTLVIGLSSGMLTYLMAAGMSLIISGMGIINFGQGAFYILGAYVCNQIFTAMGLPFGLALLGGFVVTALLGGVLERLLRFRRRRSDRVWSSYPDGRQKVPDLRRAPCSEAVRRREKRGQNASPDFQTASASVRCGVLGGYLCKQILMKGVSTDGIQNKS